MSEIQEPEKKIQHLQEVKGFFDQWNIYQKVFQNKAWHGILLERRKKQ